MKMNDGGTTPDGSDTVVFSSVPQLSIKHFLLWLCRRVKRFRIRGYSMEPTLQQGQEVLVSAPTPGTYPSPGQLVLVRHPAKKNLTMIKRCLHIEDNLVFVVGDNPSESTDSRHFGPVQLEFILGYVRCTFP